jgi:hypothetical protein
LYGDDVIVGFTDFGHSVLVAFEGGSAIFKELEEMRAADVVDPVVNGTFADPVLLRDGVNLEFAIGMTRLILFEMKVSVNLFVKLLEFWVVLDEGKRVKGLLVGVEIGDVSEAGRGDWGSVLG